MTDKVVTNSSLRKALNKLESRITAKIDDRIGEALRTNNEMLLEAVSGVMDEKLSKLKGEFFDKIDPLFKESKDSSEERTILASRVANHEDRISKLEQNSLTN